MQAESESGTNFFVSCAHLSLYIHLLKSHIFVMVINQTHVYIFWLTMRSDI